MEFMHLLIVSFHLMLVCNLSLRMNNWLHEKKNSTFICIGLKWIIIIFARKRDTKQCHTKQTTTSFSLQCNNSKFHVQMQPKSSFVIFLMDSIWLGIVHMVSIALTLIVANKEIEKLYIYCTWTARFNVKWRLFRS